MVQISMWDAMLHWCLTGGGHWLEINHPPTISDFIERARDYAKQTPRNRSRKHKKRKPASERLPPKAMVSQGEGTSPSVDVYFISVEAVPAQVAGLLNQGAERQKSGALHLNGTSYEFFQNPSDPETCKMVTTSLAKAATRLA